MENFKNWLTNQELANISVQRHVENVTRFKNWSIENDLKIEELNYRDLLIYIQELQARKVKSRSINNIIGSIKKYYDWQIEQGNRLENPAQKLRVKIPRQRISKTHTRQELNGILENYQGTTKYKIILSLIIQQGVNTSTLKALKVQDVDVEKGTIYLPATTRSNARNLPLQQTQILPLYKYLLQLDPTQENLLAGNINNHITALFTLLEPKTTLRELRTSVIVGWLKQYNRREVQYMCGHRHISSTEAYLVQDAEALKKALKDSHPLHK
ncbi:MAG: integrase/recombinase XerD [Bacteroidia bacterium]|jgi:integrase/recombinase XerD